MLDRLCSNNLGTQCAIEELVVDEWLEKVVVVVGELGTSGTGGGEKISCWGENKGERMPADARRLLPAPSLFCGYVGFLPAPGLGSGRSGTRGCRPTGLLRSNDRCLGVAGSRQSPNSSFSR